MLDTTLLGQQTGLVQALFAAVGPSRLVVVLVNGGPLSPDWVKAHCPTVVEAFEGGQSGGTALAEVIAGVVSPSGALPYTMYPGAFVNESRHGDMSMRDAPGRSYRFYQKEPLWPFGYSLSYTAWTMNWISTPGRNISVDTLRSGVEFKLQLRNVGHRASGKALLFFVSFEPATPQDYAPPKKSLFGIAKAYLAPGKEMELGLESNNLLGACAFCTVDKDGDSQVRAGAYTITVGHGGQGHSEVEPWKVTAL